MELFKRISNGVYLIRTKQGLKNAVSDCAGKNTTLFHSTTKFPCIAFFSDWKPIGSKEWGTSGTYIKIEDVVNAISLFSNDTK